MPEIALYQVDAFSARPFGGNPAAVCPLDAWLDDDLLQSIAAENNLSETAFLVPRDGDYELRWFTPTVEVDLCGHGTLASGWVVFNRLAPGRDRVTFHSRSGPLTVSRDGALLSLDFPSQPPRPFDDARGPVAEAIGQRPLELLKADKLLALLPDEATVRALRPDFAQVARLPGDGLIVTAPGDDCDFVSRYFAPHAGIPEDPVTGSAHCVLTPFWAARLGKARLGARQVSARGGELVVEDRGERVLISGRVAPFLEGRIRV